METKTYSVFEFSVGGVVDKIDRLNRRADKIGASKVEYTIGETYKKEYEDEHGRKQWADYVDFTVSTNVVSYKGWKLLAVIDHKNAAPVTNLVYVFGEKNLPKKWWKAASKCDHCRSDRQRNRTFIVKHTSGKVKQVGGTCLKDFLGQDALTWVANAQWLVELDEQMNDADFWREEGRRAPKMYPVETFMVAACAVYRMDGKYIGSQHGIEEQSTGEGAWSILKDAKVFEEVATEADRAMAEKVIAFVKNIKPENNYQSNLRAVIECAWVNGYTNNIAASAIAATNNAITEKIVNGAEKESEYFGEIKKREVFTLTVEFKTAFDSTYGACRLYAFSDANGNRATWITNLVESPEWEVGEQVTVKATVKKHELYRGKKQTVLTRVVAV